MPRAAKAAKPAAPKTKKGKVGKKEKDPNAPKRPASAYIYFSNDKRPDVKKQHPKWGVAEIGKELGKMWTDTPEGDRKKYADLAAKDKERYTKAKEEYAAKQAGEEEAKPSKEEEDDDEEVADKEDAEDDD